MDYQKIYDNLMSTRMNIKHIRHEQRKKGIYFEGHHIIPISKGGTGTSTRGLRHPNIVLLTAREHFLAHWLLWRIHRDRASALAFSMMNRSTKSHSRIKSSRAYEEIRVALSETNKGNQYGKGHTKIISEDQRKRHSEFMKGRFSGEKNHYFGKKHSGEVRKKISEKAKNRIPGTYKGPRVVIKDGVILGEFKKTEDVADFIGCSCSKVKAALAGNRKDVDGYTIRYKKDYNLLK